MILRLFIVNVFNYQLKKNFAALVAITIQEFSSTQNSSFVIPFICPCCFVFFFKQDKNILQMNILQSNLSVIFHSSVFHPLIQNIKLLHLFVWMMLEDFSAESPKNLAGGENAIIFFIFYI